MSTATASVRAERIVVLSDGRRVVAIGDHSAYLIRNGRCSCPADGFRAVCAHLIASRIRPALIVSEHVIDVILADPRDRRRALAVIARTLSADDLEQVIRVASEIAVGGAQ